MNEQEMKKRVAGFLGVYSPRIEALKQRRAELMGELQALRGELIGELHKLRLETARLVSSLDKDIKHLRGRSSGMTGKGRKASVKIPSGLLVPMEEYRAPILEALIEMGGRGRPSDILPKVEQKMNGRLTSLDYKMLKDGRTVKWRNRAQWERARMVEDGCLKTDSPRGIWEITDAGRALYQELKASQQTSG